MHLVGGLYIGPLTQLLNEKILSQMNLMSQTSNGKKSFSITKQPSFFLISLNNDSLYISVLEELKSKMKKYYHPFHYLP